MMLVCCITQLLGIVLTYLNITLIDMLISNFIYLLADIRMNLSTPILASFVLLSIPIRDSQSTPKGRWTFILVYIYKAYFMYTIDLTYDDN